MENTDKQNATELNNPYDSLTEDQQLAVDMAVENVPYPQIAKEFKVKHGTVRVWFMRGGTLYEAVKYAKKERNKEYKKLFKGIEDQLREIAVDAVVTLRSTVKQKNMVGVVAAKDVLDRAGFKPTEKLEHSNDPDNPIEGSKVIIYLPDNEREKPTDH